MWIVYIKDKACFWLLGGELYSVGKKDCHIIINDDASISRRHLTLEVGLMQTAGESGQKTRKDDAELTEDDEGVEIEDEERAAPIILTDMSTYGSSVCPLLPSCRAKDGTGDKEDDYDDGDNDITRELGLYCSRALDVVNTDDNVSGADLGLFAGSTCKLVKGRPFCVPCEDLSWREFIITLGTHGALLSLRWVPMRVFIVGIVADEKPKLDCCLRRCCANVVKNFNHADYLVTSLLVPTPVAIAALCRAVDIVRPAYFEALQDRHGPHVPPPDPRTFAPALAEFWSLLWNGVSGEKSQGGGKIESQSRNEGLRENTIQEGWEELLLYPPKRLDRQMLFAGLTFVTVQRSLFREVRFFLPFAQGMVLFDDSLKASCDEERRRQLLSSFYLLHSRHVILYNNRDIFPFAHFVRIARDQLGMCCVEYLDLIKSIARNTPLELTPFPTGLNLKPPQKELLVGGKNVSGGGETGESAAKTTAKAAGVKRPHKVRSSDGRRTDPNPLFGEPLSDIEAEGGNASAGRWCDDCGDYQTRTDDGKGVIGGWIRREPKLDSCSKNLVLAGPRALPPYPCFQPHIKSGKGVTTQLQPAAVVFSGVKCFRKQGFAVCNEKVEMDRSTGVPGDSVLLPRRAIDSDDIIPEVVGGGSGVSSSRLHFNAFDVTAKSHEFYNKAATTRRRVGRRDVAHEVPVAAREARQRDERANGLAGMPCRKGTGGAAANIFDIDAFF